MHSGRLAKHARRCPSVAPHQFGAPGCLKAPDEWDENGSPEAFGDQTDALHDRATLQLVTSGLSPLTAERVGSAAMSVCRHRGSRAVAPDRQMPQ